MVSLKNTIITSLVILFGCISQPAPAYNLTNTIKACVKIEVYDAEKYLTGSGSGVVVDCDYEDTSSSWRIKVLTAKHITGPGYKIRLLNGPAIDVIGVHTHPGNVDIMVLEALSTRPIKPVELASQLPRLGDRLITIGYPKGYGPLLTEGRAGSHWPIEGEDLMLCTCNIYFGTSGGGVVDTLSGKLVGISVRVQSGMMGEPVTFMQGFVPINKFSEWLKGVL